MKNYLFLALCMSTLATNTAFAQDYPVSIYTPKGSLVPNVWHLAEMSAAEIAYWNNHVDTWYDCGTRLSSASRRYNCHAYAWHMTEGGGSVWIGYGVAGSEAIYWTDGSYAATSQHVGAKVSYTGDHSAVVTSTGSKPLTSKWGSYPRMQHSSSCSPGGYGSPQTYYRIDVVPPVPTNFTITNPGSFGQHPKLVWDKVMTGDTYNVYRCFDMSVGCSYQKIWSGAQNSFVDNEIVIVSGGPGAAVYRVTSQNEKGESAPTMPFGVGAEADGAREESLASEQAPDSYALFQNYPNPFNPSTVIRFAIPEASEVNVSVYDVMGREVATLINKKMEAGSHSVLFDASHLPSGAYYCRVRAGDFSETRQIILAK